MNYEVFFRCLVDLSKITFITLTYERGEGGTQKKNLKRAKDVCF